MGEVLLNTSVIIYLLSETILFVLLSIALFFSIQSILKWDYSSYSKEQYTLEKRAFLIISIVGFVFFIKFFLLPYFVYVIDGLSNIVSGAMCGAGVISANSYGMVLLFIKLLIIFMLIFWMGLNHYDLESKNYRYFIPKNWLFIGIFLLLSIEIVLDFLYFSNIEINQPVSCCSTLFGQLEGANPLPFGVDIKLLLILFFTLFILVEISLLFEQNFVSIISLALFLYISYYAVVYFFGTYVYELPSHKCPFCMLQKEYYYIGYLIWGSLFGGAFIGIVASLLSLLIKANTKKAKIISAWLLAIFVIVCVGEVGVYYLKNGVFL